MTKLQSAEHSDFSSTTSHSAALLLTYLALFSSEFATFLCCFFFHMSFCCLHHLFKQVHFLPPKSQIRFLSLESLTSPTPLPPNLEPIRCPWENRLASAPPRPHIQPPHFTSTYPQINARILPSHSGREVPVAFPSRLTSHYTKQHTFVLMQPFSHVCITRSTYFILLLP